LAKGETGENPLSPDWLSETHYFAVLRLGFAQISRIEAEAPRRVMGAHSALDA
jgi:hypothetical protein